jgi:hypothetical protein
MYELYKRNRRIGRYSSKNSAIVIANRMRGDERFQRFTIVNGRNEWTAMVPPKGGGKTRWEKVA